MRTLRLEIESRVEHVERVRSAVEGLLERAGVEEDRRERFGLAVAEAVANAIVHGNDGEPRRRVVIDVALDGDLLAVDVGDDGGGFDPDGVADPRVPERLLAREGRGVLLMRAAFDEIACRSGLRGGSVVALRARLAAPSTFEKE